MLDLEFYVHTFCFSFNTLHISLHSCLYCLWQKVQYNSYPSSFTGKVSPANFFNIFSFSLVFCCLDMTCLGVEFGGNYPVWCSLSLLNL